MLNPRSGAFAKLGMEQGRARVAAACEANGLVATIEMAPGRQIAESVERRLTRREDPLDVVVVGGGDGSIGAAAAVLAGGAVPLGILPLGTFNHFARDLGLPLDLEAALRVIARCHTTSVDVGEVNGRIFLNNSSLGIYPHLVAERDRQRRQGIARWGAAALAICRVLWRLPRPRVRVLAAGWQRVRRTPCLFIGNNIYQLDPFAIAKRARLDQGELCLYMTHRQSRLALLRLAVAAFLGRLEPGRDFEVARLEAVDIAARRHRLRVALDGESVVLQPPLHYRILPRALRVIAPEPEPA